MIVRETQTPAYWQEFAVDDRDLDYLYELFLEDDSRPRTTDDLALALVRSRCEREEALIERELARGTPFQPKDSYEVGEQVVFPTLGYAFGSVVGLVVAYFTQKDHEVQITAHRGSSRSAPENSLSALTQAIADTAD